MKDKYRSPFQSINPAYRRIPVVKQDIDIFAEHLSSFLKAMNETESEEYNKNVFTKFLYDSFYNSKNNVNTKGRIDLAIYENETPLVVFEFKKPKKNDADMISKDNLNAKAMHQLIKYYFDERVKHNNTNIKYLIASNAYEWFVFDERDFDRLYGESKLKKDYETCIRENKNEDYFYKIAKSFLEKEKPEIEFAYFDLREQKDRSKIRSLYKFFSPQHLLKQPFANDSNTLNKEFYNELLHIIGLEEIKDGSKKLISRKEKPDEGSILENVIFKLKQKDRLGKLRNASSFGETEDEQYFGVALELCITWVDRILFLKLLESQLIRYHKGNPDYKFLNIKTVQDFDELGNLFFSVLAKKTDERDKRVKEKFAHVPYLNSSLFEESDLEKDILGIDSLDNNHELEILKGTKLLDGNKSQKGKLRTIEYLFRFLDSYNFASEGTDEEQEDRKALINASVLGLIFEKINGYKDGSFFTPGFITMYMCKETLRRAVVQKFNEKYSWKCEDFGDLKNHLMDKKSKKEIIISNEVINDLKICDPAVGSGHFLVSALNELIAIKSELGILADKGERLPVNVSVENDELMITDGENIFEYTAPVGKNPDKVKQQIQKTLFHEKEKLIEDCLFGVDINGNSVKICRLRLWIELLKNAYYTEESGFTELETLPNIDINIKRGNSLVSRFTLDADLTKALKSIKYTIEHYRAFVKDYKNEKDRNVKRGLLKIIEQIKNDFKIEINKNSKKYKKLQELQYEYNLLVAPNIFREEQADYGNKNFKKQAQERIHKLGAEINRRTKELRDIENNVIYKNAFEWRFEFPEVMDNNGDFVGFDVVIGNPPYVGIEDITWDSRRFYETIYKTATGRFDLYSLFIEKAMQLKQPTGIFTFIIPGKFLNNKQFVIARKIICDNHGVTVVKIDDKVFDEAQVDSVIVENYSSENAKYKALKITSQELQPLSETDVASILQDKEIIFRLEINTKFDNLISKIESDTLRVREIADVKDGIVAGTIKDLLFLDEKKDKDSYKLYFGKHISRFHLADTEVWVNYKLEEMMKQEVKRQGYKRIGLWMRDKKIFEREKIIYRKVGKELIATFAEKGIYYEQTIHSCHITDKRFKTKFVLGLFNSTLFKFYYRKTNSQGGDIFPQIRISSVENLPIKYTDNKTQDKIEKLVDKILDLKKKNPIANTIALEKQIDEMVYELYGLTKAEREIVEGK